MQLFNPNYYPRESACNPHKSASFTLIELLVVIGIIAILAAAVIIAINPARQLAQARNARRRADARALLDASYQYGIAHQGDFSGLGLNSNFRDVGQSYSLELKLEDQTKAIYHMNEGDNIFVNDLIGNNNGTLLLGTLGNTSLEEAWVESKAVLNKAINFDGADDVVTIAHYRDLDFGSNNFSIEAWIKPDPNFTGYGDIAIKGNFNQSAYPGEGNWEFWYANFCGGGKMCVGFYFDSYLPPATNSTAYNVGATSLNDGKWHYVVAVRDGDLAKIFIDGLEDGTPNVYNSPIGSTDSTAFPGIGNWPNDPNYGFKGIIDEVRITQRVLTPEEIRNNYEKKWRDYLVSTYIASIPKDPVGGTEEITKYEAKIEEGRITIKAKGAELGETIEITR